MLGRSFRIYTNVSLTTVGGATARRPDPASHSRPYGIGVTLVASILVGAVMKNECGEEVGPAHEGQAETSGDKTTKPWAIFALLLLNIVVGATFMAFSYGAIGAGKAAGSTLSRDAHTGRSSRPTGGLRRPAAEPRPSEASSVVYLLVSTTL